MMWLQILIKDIREGRNMFCNSSLLVFVSHADAAWKKACDSQVCVRNAIGYKKYFEVVNFNFCFLFFHSFFSSA